MTEILELVEGRLVHVAEYPLWMVNGHRKMRRNCMWHKSLFDLLSQILN